MAITRKALTAIKNLSRKKDRDESGFFTAEGIKVVEDLLLAGFQPQKLLTTEDFIPDSELFSGVREVIDPKEMERISALDSPSPVLAVFKKPLECPTQLTEGGLSLVLDDIQNPGNLGTIFRTAEWFGVQQIFCSTGCADPFGPKTVQAAMGSLGRVATTTIDLVKLLEQAQKLSLPVYGAFLEGRNVYQVPLQNRGVLVLGNEGRGINHLLENLITTKLHIPSYGKSKMESLNVAMAAGILLSEFRRKQ